MKRLVLATVLAIATPFAHAASPSPQQVDALLQAMDMKSMLPGMLAQIDGATQQMARSMLPADATAEQRAKFDRVMAQQQAFMRDALTWEKLAPIYRTVYGDVFTAEEVQAMTRFYTSPEGRSTLQKMPAAVGRTMQEMQPMMQSLMQQSQQMLQKELGTPAAPAK